MSRKLMPVNNQTKKGARLRDALMTAEGEGRETECLKGKALHAAIEIKTTLEGRSLPTLHHEAAVLNRVSLTAQQVPNKAHNAETIGSLASVATDSKAAPVKDELDSKAAPVNGAMANISKATPDNAATDNISKAVTGKGVIIVSRVAPDKDVTANNSVGKVNKAHIKRIMDTATVTDNLHYMANAKISTETVHNDKVITSVVMAPSKVTDNNGME